MVKALESEKEFRQAYRLRHRVFAEKLRWVPEREDRLESDIYDAWSTAIGIFSSQNELLGMVRMTPAPFPFMLESEFSGCLVGSHHVRKELDTAEITRLAVDPTIADRGLSAKLMRTIFKGMYHWTLANNIRYTYLVVESRLLRVVQRIGWPCHAIGAPVALPPAHVLSVGALLDLDEFRANAASRKPEMLAWLHSTEPVTTVIVEKL
ncbi:MAG: GNAT family N-acetyltransferase [Nitrospirota bacterium]|nr:GNAT family N-acetyltransferase [Nitrospirota bacterium]